MLLKRTYNFLYCCHSIKATGEFEKHELGVPKVLKQQVRKKLNSIFTCAILRKKGETACYSLSAGFTAQLKYKEEIMQKHLKLIGLQEADF